MNFLEEVQHHRGLYVDLECLCWDTVPPPGMKQEIIEIGVVEMDLRTLQVVQEASYFIRPERWEVSAMCTRLTGVTRADILSGRPFVNVIADIALRFQPSATPTCAWGDDYSLISKTCESMRLTNPFRQPIDLCKVFQGVLATRQQIGLKDAVTMMGLEFDGVPHGALPDARNAARVHAAMMRRMRLEPLRSKTLSATPVEPVQLSPFAQKLAHSLKPL